MVSLDKNKLYLTLDDSETVGLWNKCGEKLCHDAEKTGR